MEAPLNSDAQDIHTSSTDRAIWPASDRAGGLGRSDIYRIGKDGTAEHLAAPINRRGVPLLHESPRWIC